MTFRNAEAWKSAVKRYAKANNLSVSDAQQRYILDEFASKIADSIYRDSFVLKGGYIVSTLLGIDNRTTRDIDLTFCSTIYSKNEIEAILNDIIKIENDCFFDFEVSSIKEGQVDDGYNGFTVMLKAVHEKTRLDMKLDISNNTLIFPGAIQFSIESIFTGEKIGVMSYPIENIIAEKFETTLDRGEFNGRIRDLFDVAMLWDTQQHLIDVKMLSDCIIEVSKERGTFDNLYYFDNLVFDLKSSPIFNKNFEKYKKTSYPNSDLSLEKVFDVFSVIYDNLKPLLPEKSLPPLKDRILSAGERAAMQKREKDIKEINHKSER